VVVLEEEPQTPAIAALPSAVLLLEGVCEKGPICDPQLATGFSEWSKLFGGFLTSYHTALAAHGYFSAGGAYCWTNRIVHFTDLTNPATHTAVKGTRSLLNAGNVATAGSVTSTEAQPFNLRHETLLTLDLSTNGGGPTTATILATQASVVNVGGETFNFTGGGQGLTVRVDGGAVQTITFLVGDFAVPGAATAEEVAARINASIVGATCTVTGTGTTVTITSDKKGSDSSIQVTGGTANAILAFQTTLASSVGSNVANLAAVTGAELEAILEAAVADLAVTVNSGGTLTLATETTGASTWVSVEASSGLDVALGLNNTQHYGTAATPAATLKVDTKYFGAYGTNITTTVEAAQSGKASEFTFKVLKSGVVVETFPNLTMDDALANYAEAVVNHPTAGSVWVAVTDLDAAGTPTQQRPANGTSGALTGGDDGLTSLADADYTGNVMGGTGLYAFDRVTSGRILILPGITSANVCLAMLEYAGAWRNGSMFCVLDCPSGYTKAQVATWVETNGLLEHLYGEFGAVYWPWIRVANPQPSVYGTDDTIVVPYSGWVAGTYARNDQKIGGVYESPAGVGGGWGVIPGIRGVEDDPEGLTDHPVLDERVRDFIYPLRINPITKLPGQGWHIDGGRTLKSTGNFPNIGERRGVIFIAESLKAGFVILKHRFNNKANRQKANRIATRFLTQEMNKGAFRSTNADEAFYVDTTDILNPLSAQFAGVMNIRVGLATNKPTEYIVIVITQDTRGLTEAA
jgi:hypothetical protein